MPERAQEPSPRGLGIGGGLTRHAERLMDQQMWCLGRDIRHEGGNALLRRGFAVVRPPDGVVGGSAYTLTTLSGDRLILWGFGLCFGGADPAAGLILLRRFGFEPSWRAGAPLPSAAWDTTRLPRFARPRSESEWAHVRTLTARALLALADHEDWVNTTLGLGHRQICIAAWFKERYAPAQMAASWRALARRLDPNAPSALMGPGRVAC